jgi:putative DNA primase/helicase
MITGLIDLPYEPAATCPTFEAFLRRVLGGDNDLISYVQKAVGYSLTGSVQEQVFFFLHGEGQNGKSTLAGLLLKLFGDYGKTGAPDLLMARHHDQHPAEQADLEGARLVVCQEIAEGRSWNERTLKHLTGGDKIKARLMHKDWREFWPTHKLWVCANPKPKMREGGHATWRRVRLIPFDVVIPAEERDSKLGEKLAGEMTGVLRWAVEGCIRWQREGLKAPSVVSTATDGYREASDHVATFSEDRLVFGEDQHVAKAVLYEAYTFWCRQNRETPHSRGELQKRLIARGLTDGRNGRERLLVGASLRGAAPG